MKLVVGALIVDDLARPARVLAARRTGPMELAGRWEFPGGKVEPGESPQDALRRELMEELSIDVRVGRELTRDGGTWPISDDYEMRLYYVSITHGSPLPGESHDAVRWLGTAELRDVDWLDSDRDAVAPRVRIVATASG